MIKYIFFFFLFIAFQSEAQQGSDSKLILEAIYAGENIYLQNPFADLNMTYCTDSVFVNGKRYMFDLNQSAFEIKLDSVVKVQGTDVTIIIYHKKTCKPKVLQPMSFPPPRSKVTFTSFNIDTTGHVHITTLNEPTGNRPPLKIEQLIAKTWRPVLAIPQKWETENTYDTVVSLLAGTNTFRLSELMYEKAGKIITVKSAGNQKIIQARLISSVKNDTVYFNNISLNGKQNIDLKFCSEKFSYPPHLPVNFFWIKPDSLEKSSDETGDIKYKYLFDTNGRVTLYYYQGSVISGIFPLPYQFEYESEKSNRIKLITDPFYKNAYVIHYKNNIVHTIEKLDALNKRIEILIIDAN